MNYTNNHNIPDTIAKAVMLDTYKKEGRISVTQLVKPTQIRVLEARHYREITVDVSDCLWRLLGEAVHYVLEKGEMEEDFTEERLGIDVNGVRITGKIDRYSGVENKVIDYKVTSVYSFMSGVKQEWEAQLNLYRLLYENAGFTVRGLEIHAILRDWSKAKVNGNNYPLIPFQKIETPMWSTETAWNYLKDRVRIHLEAENRDDMFLPPCSSDEQWERPTKFALMKEGGKRAVKVFDDAELATTALNEKNETNRKNSYYLEERPGKKVRCDYCSAQPFCHQYRKENDSFRLTA